MKALSMLRRIVAIGLAFLIGSPADSAVAGNDIRYSVIEIPQDSTTGASINNAHAVTGSTAEHAFLYSHGKLIDLGTLGGEISSGSGINSRGDITGHSQLFPNDFGTIHAFLFRRGVMVDLGTLGGRSYGQAINDAGIVVGYSELGDNFTTRAFLYRRGVMHELGTLGGFDSWAYGINNKGDVTGSSQPEDGGPVIHAFVYQDGTMADIGTLGGPNSEGRDINDAGQVTGWSYRSGDNFHHAFLYSNGVMIDLGIGALESDGVGINSAGDVVGSECDRAPVGCRAFLYSRGKVIDLNSVLDPATGAGWRISFARDINDAGWIVADGCNELQDRCSALILKPRSVHCRPDHDGDHEKQGHDKRCDHQ